MASSDPWTIGRCLRWTGPFFTQRGLPSGRLDAEILLAHVLQVGRIVLYTDDGRPLQAQELADFRALVQRRAVGEPVAYIVGGRDFYGHRFRVDPRVLVPRPETEHLVDEALALLAATSPAPAAGHHVVDVGTGSGAVALSIALAPPPAASCAAGADGGRDGLWVTATDCSPAALDVCADNAQGLWPDHAGRLALCCGDLLAAAAPRLAARPATLVVANLPYIARAQLGQLPADVRLFEPHLALDGGEDGLDLLRRLLGQAAGVLGPGGALMMEVGAGQAQAVAALAEAAGHWRTARLAADLAGHLRVVCLSRQGTAAC